jgi:hypothetical protein
MLCFAGYNSAVNHSMLFCRILGYQQLLTNA